MSLFRWGVCYLLPVTHLTDSFLLASLEQHWRVFNSWPPNLDPRTLLPLTDECPYEQIASSACPDSPRLLASGFPEQARRALWRSRGCIFKQLRACVCPCLLLHSPEQDGVICAFYISMAEEAASRWLYLFQSHLFMQKEDCVTSFQVNVFCKPWK